MPQVVVKKVYRVDQTISTTVSGFNVITHDELDPLTLVRTLIDLYVVKVSTGGPHAMAWRYEKRPNQVITLDTLTVTSGDQGFLPDEHIAEGNVGADHLTQVGSTQVARLKYDIKTARTIEKDDRLSFAFVADASNGFSIFGTVTTFYAV